MLVAVTPGTLLLLLLLEPHPATRAASTQMAATAIALWLCCLILYLLLVVDCLLGIREKPGNSPSVARLARCSITRRRLRGAYSRDDRAHPTLDAARPDEHRRDQDEPVDREWQIVGDVRRQRE